MFGRTIHADYVARQEALETHVYANHLFLVYSGERFKACTPDAEQAVSLADSIPDGAVYEVYKAEQSSHRVY